MLFTQLPNEQLQVMFNLYNEMVESLINKINELKQEQTIDLDTKTSKLNEYRQDLNEYNNVVREIKYELVERGL